MNYLIIFLLALAPIAELRGALPIAILKYNLAFWPSLIICVLGTFLAGALVLLLLNYLEILIDKWAFSHDIKEKVFTYTRNKHADKFERLKEILVFILAAIPIPFVGGSYTAALIAYLFNADKVKSLLFIFLGVVLQGVIIAFSLKLI